MKLILHIGTHKTGTTSIQKSLSSNRQWLYENGYNYPILEKFKNSHNELARKIATVSQEQLESLRQIILKSCKKSHSTIISSEELYVRIVGNDGWSNLNVNDYWYQREKYLERIAYIFQDFSQIEVFMCLRPVSCFAESLYATKVISTSKNRYDSFEDFLNKMLPAFEYKKHVELLTKHFNHINLISFNKLSTNLIDNFYKWTEIPLPPDVISNIEKKTPDKRLVYWFSLALNDLSYEKYFNALREFVKTQKCSIPRNNERKLTFFRFDRDRSYLIKVSQNFMAEYFGIIEGKVNDEYVALNSNEIHEIKTQFRNWKKKKKRKNFFFKYLTIFLGK